MTLRLGDQTLSPVRVGDAWEELRARLDAPPHGDYEVTVEVRADDGRGPIGVAVDHVLVMPAGSDRPPRSPRSPCGAAVEDDGAFGVAA